MTITLSKETVTIKDRVASIDNTTLRTIFTDLGVTPPTGADLILYVQKGSGSKIKLAELKTTDLVLLEFVEQTTTAT